MTDCSQPRDADGIAGRKQGRGVSESGGRVIGMKEREDVEPHRRTTLLAGWAHLLRKWRGWFDWSAMESRMPIMEDGAVGAGGGGQPKTAKAANAARGRIKGRKLTDSVGWDGGSPEEKKLDGSGSPCFRMS